MARKACPIVSPRPWDPAGPSGDGSGDDKICG